MNAVDTNVLIYSLDEDEPVKQAKAGALLSALMAEPVPHKRARFFLAVCAAA